jgi:sugar fermentation stimulation protein A
MIARTPDTRRVDSGVYLFALELARPRTLAIGSLGNIRFDEGWYVYVGSARRSLSLRLARHERINGKTLRWHIDFLRVAARTTRAFPIQTCNDLECRLARDAKAISDGMVPGFGSSDCSCPSHLFRFLKDPLKDVRFISLLRRYRQRGCAAPWKEQGRPTAGVRLPRAEFPETIIRGAVKNGSQMQNVGQGGS